MNYSNPFEWNIKQFESNERPIVSSAELICRSDSVIVAHNETNHLRDKKLSFEVSLMLMKHLFNPVYVFEICVGIWINNSLDSQY